MLIEKKTKKQCFTACSKETKDRGGCSCVNRIREELNNKNKGKQQLNG